MQSRGVNALKYTKNAQETLELLRDVGVNIKGKLPKAVVTAPVYIAAYFGSLNAVTKLYQRGYDINETEKYGATPVSVAVQRKDFPMAKFLCGVGADVNMPDENGTPLYKALRNKKMENLLLKYGAKLNNIEHPPRRRVKYMSDEEKVRSFFRGAFKGNEKLVEFWLQNGLKANMVREAGDDVCTPLYVALGGGHYDVVKILLDYGANDLSIDDLAVAFHRAERNGCEDVSQLLLTEMTIRICKEEFLAKDESPLIGPKGKAEDLSLGSTDLSKERMF